MVDLIITNISITHYIVALVTLSDKGIKQSQSPRETDDFELNFQPCKDKPNSHAWNTKGSFRSNHLPFILTCGQVHHKRLQDHTHFQSAGRTPVARLHVRTPGCPCNTYSHTSNQVTRRSKYEWWKVCPLLGLIGY
jgi:hypothetical protein